MEKIINLCTKIAAYVCPLLNEEQREHTEELLSEIMNEARKMNES